MMSHQVFKRPAMPACAGHRTTQFTAAIVLPPDELLRLSRTLEHLTSDNPPLRPDIEPA